MDLVAQIRMLLAGGSPITPSVARRLLTRLGPRANTTAPPAFFESDVTLSKQETAVLQFCAKGYSYDEIARLLRLSRHTVETYVKRIYRKLQVHSKTEAVYEGR
jgi:DNA-binding NarL/FixJ family response regulator